MSNNLPKFTPQQIKSVDRYVGIIHLVTGKTAKAEDFFAYVCVRPSFYEEFRNKLDKIETLNLEAYGKILYKGFGLRPSEDERRYMEEEFGIDHHFVEGFPKT